MRSNAEIARLLLNAGADANLATRLAIGPLAVAIENGSADVARLLLDNGADPNAVRESGESPLMTATRTRQLGVMARLLDSGADVNLRDRRFGQTALMWAAGNPAAVRLLLDRGADVHPVSKAWDVDYVIFAPPTTTLGGTGIPWNTSG